MEKMTEDEKILAIVEADVALKKAIPFGMTNFYIAESAWTISLDPASTVGWLDEKGEVCEAVLSGRPLEGETMAILTCQDEKGNVFNLIVFKDHYHSAGVPIEHISN